MDNFVGNNAILSDHYYCFIFEDVEECTDGMKRLNLLYIYIYRITLFTALSNDYKIFEYL